jgi:hypothetical protein
MATAIFREPRTSSQQFLRSSRHNECVHSFRRDSQTRPLGQGVHYTGYVEGQAMRVHARVGAGAVLLLALGVKSRIVQNCARPKQLYG